MIALYVVAAIALFAVIRATLEKTPAGSFST